MTDDVIILESEVILKMIKYEGIVWIPAPNQPKKQPKSRPVDTIDPNFTKPVERHRKQNYFVKWLKTNKLEGEIFVLEDFYMAHPKHKTDKNCRRRIEKVIAEMIKDNKLQQLGTDRFKVLK